MKRLAYVCADPGVPLFGHKGSSVHVGEVVRALLDRGIAVTVLARRVGGAAPAGLEAARVIKLPEPAGTGADRERAMLISNASTRQALEHSGPFDAVYERHALWSYAGMEHAAERGIPGLLEVNAPLVLEQRTYRSLALEHEAEQAADRAFSSATAILAVSSALAEWLEANPAARGRVHVVRNGVDTHRIHPDARPASPSPTLTVGFVGTLRPWHGIETLAEAFMMLRERGVRCRLLIVGDGPVREAVEARLSPHARDVHWTGAITPDAVPGYLASMDIAVAPYPPMEGFYFSPLKLFEYMASGRAIVASDIGQVSEVIEDGTTGLLCAPGDAAALADAIAALAGDPALRRRLGSAARSAAERRHRWDAVVDRTLELATWRAVV